MTRWFLKVFLVEVHFSPIHNLLAKTIHVAKPAVNRVRKYMWYSHRKAFHYKFHEREE